MMCRDAGKLLHAHRQTLLNEDEEDISSIPVRRKHIFDDAILTLKRINWEPTQHLRVVFIGEPGVDEGGPTREFF